MAEIGKASGGRGEEECRERRIRFVMSFVPPRSSPPCKGGARGFESGEGPVPTTVTECSCRRVAGPEAARGCAEGHSGSVFKTALAWTAPPRRGCGKVGFGGPPNRAWAGLGAEPPHPLEPRSLCLLGDSSGPRGKGDVGNVAFNGEFP